jgi:DNA polymerase-3 subunit gamma/tau
MQRIREELANASGEAGEDPKNVLQLEEAFTEEQLRTAWGKYLNALKQDNRDVEHTTLNRPIVLEAGHTIVLEFDNAVQSIILERLQQDLVHYLRTSLKNRNINVSGKVRQQAGERKVYTNKEKFEYLADKYPKLKDLRDRLDLDTDF